MRIINNLIILSLLFVSLPALATSNGASLEYIRPGKSLGIRTKVTPEALTLNGSMALTKLSSKPSASAGYGKVYVNGNNLYYNNGGSLFYLINNASLASFDGTTFLRSDTSDNYTSGVLTFDSGTSFVAAAGSTLDINSTLVSIADPVIEFDGASTTFNGTTGAMTLKPAATTNLNVSLSGAGDFAVNTNQLYVDTSTTNVGIGTTTPTSKLYVNGTTFTKGFALNGTALSLAQGSLLYSQVAGSASMLAKGNNHYMLKVNGNTLAWEAASSRLQDATLNGVTSIVDGSLFITTSTPSLGYVLASDATGLATWVPPGSLTGTGDNLGNHNATMRLNMDSQTIINAIAINGTTALTLNPANGSNLNVDLRGVSDFIVDTDKFTVNNNGNVGISYVNPPVKLMVNGTTAFLPSAITTVTAGTALTVSRSIMKIKANSGTVDFTANPQIVAGVDGQMVIIIGHSSTNTVKFDDGDGLSLTDGLSMTLSNGDSLELMYDSTFSKWLELDRSDK